MLDEARTAVFSMSMDSAKKKEMEDFFENLGLTLTSGVNIFFEASVIWAKMPFEVSREETEIPDMTGRTTGWQGEEGSAVPCGCSRPGSARWSTCIRSLV